MISHAISEPSVRGGAEGAAIMVGAIGVEATGVGAIGVGATGVGAGAGAGAVVALGDVEGVEGGRVNHMPRATHVLVTRL